MFSKGVQVYEDVLKQKYNWKPELKNRMIQTDDIILEKLAMEQYEFRKSLPFQRYFMYTKQSAMQPPMLVHNRSQMISVDPQHSREQLLLEQQQLTPSEANQNLLNHPLASTRMQSNRTQFNGAIQAPMTSKLHNAPSQNEVSSVKQNEDLDVCKSSTSSPARNNKMALVPLMKDQIAKKSNPEIKAHLQSPRQPVNSQPPSFLVQGAQISKVLMPIADNDDASGSAGSTPLLVNEGKRGADEQKKISILLQQRSQNSPQNPRR